MLPDGVGYLRLSDFVISGTTLPNGTELLADLDRRLDDLDAQGAQSLVLDLRNNGGGSVQTADELLGRFLPDTARSVHESDQRGHDTYELASGRLHAAPAADGGADQRRLGVGVRNHGRGAARCAPRGPGRPAHGRRGRVVRAAAAARRRRAADRRGRGQRGRSTAQLDGVGITPDVDTSPTAHAGRLSIGPRPAARRRRGGAGQRAAPPADAVPQSAAISSAELDRLLGGALPGSGDVPTNDRLTATNRWQRLDFIHPNELIDQNGGAPDPLALQQTMRARGYQGSVFATYGGTPGDLPAVSVDVDLYATADGAHAAVSTNDLPALQEPIDAPVQAGDETVAYRGAWLATGSTLIAWRRGRVVFTVTYSDVPGFDRPDTARRHRPAGRRPRPDSSRCPVVQTVRLLSLGRARGLADALCCRAPRRGRRTRASADWLRTVRDTALWSGPADPSVQFTTLPLGSFLQPRAGSDQGRLLVYYPGDGATRQAGVAWVAAPDVAPSGPPPWIAASELDGDDRCHRSPSRRPHASLPIAPPPVTRPEVAVVDDDTGLLLYGRAPARARSTGQHDQDRHGDRHPRARPVAGRHGARHRRRRGHGGRRRLVDHGPCARPAADHPHPARMACCCPAATTPPSSSRAASAESRDQFISWMNALAADDLGLADTHFVNPSGLDADGHYSSAYDLAQLARRAMRDDVFREIVATPQVTSRRLHPRPATTR